MLLPMLDAPSVGHGYIGVPRSISYQCRNWRSIYPKQQQANAIAFTIANAGKDQFYYGFTHVISIFAFPRRILADLPPLPCFVEKYSHKKRFSSNFQKNTCCYLFTNNAELAQWRHLFQHCDKIWALCQNLNLSSFG